MLVHSDVFFFLPLCSKAFVSFFSLCICILQGFTYPHEAGYPIESRQAKYYLMETHYNNLKPDFAQLHARQMADNSGLKIYFTHVLRPNDAGILSIGKYICLSIEGHVDKCVCKACVCVCVCFMQWFYMCNSCHAIYEIAETQNDRTRETERQRGREREMAAQPPMRLVKQKLMSLLSLSASLCVSVYVCAVGKGVSWRSSSATEPNKEPHTLSMRSQTILYYGIQ